MNAIMTLSDPVKNVAHRLNLADNLSNSAKQKEFIDVLDRFSINCKRCH